MTDIDKINAIVEAILDAGWAAHAEPFLARELRWMAFANDCNVCGHEKEIEVESDEQDDQLTAWRVLGAKMIEEMAPSDARDALQAALAAS